MTGRTASNSFVRSSDAYLLDSTWLQVVEQRVGVRIIRRQTKEFLHDRFALANCPTGVGASCPRR
jgi:hypothetical protein